MAQLAILGDQVLTEAMLRVLSLTAIIIILKIIIIIIISFLLGPLALKLTIIIN